MAQRVEQKDGEDKFCVRERDAFHFVIIWIVTSEYVAIVHVALPLGIGGSIGELL